MSDLFWNTITENMKFVLNGFSQSGIGKYFYLAGGTALALQLGHRHSVDLDFFSPTEDIPTIRSGLEEALAPFDATLTDSAWGNLVYVVKGVRIGFYGYGYPLLESVIEKEDLHLASITDIALMKLDTLLTRAARKDFYDLYFICQKIPLRQLLDLAPQKYPSVRDFEAQVVKRLVYFENAENETDPSLLKPVTWQAVKDYFIEQAKKIGQVWLQ
ncbi:MAG TPA: nucleotidyl transferase AbiEii/AbiGii toxin family protein [Anaerolineales bacterium]|nr:nucleotidyl transferase AbiEii/AbiGii toxin family protein [Anaerolineales bacterium]